MAGSSTLPTERKSKKSSIEESPIFVVSTSGHLTEELQCSICLDVFTDPVTTPCGHNFCKTCLNECWDNSQDHKCPYCKEAYNQRPDLKINTTLREVVDHYKEKTGLTKFEVPCDACAGRKIKAMKSCLDCGLTFCKVHLEPHNTVAKYKKHKLIDPVENLENYICQKHERPLVLFCRDDQTCVCLFCTEGDHKTHNTVPIEEESKERQGKLAKTQTEVQQMIQDRSLKIQEIKNSVILSKVNAEKEKTDSFEVFTALIRSIERCQAELLEVMEEKQKAAEKQAEDLIKELQQEITELQRRDTELEQLSHTEDHLHLLQIYPSLCSPLNTKKRKEIRFKTHLNMDTLRRSVVQLQKTLDEKLSKIVLTEMQQFAVDVTLDPDTAHPELILSDDGKQVKHTDKKQNVPINPKRFDHCSCVLGREGFSSGRFYYEVQVKDKTDWDLGVACESIKRKGEIIIGPQNGFWTIYLRNGNVYKVPNNPSLPLSLRVKPQKVGVFVDYEEGLVSFYDVESRSHIYSFTGQSFTEKLYPYFSTDNNHGGKNSAPLIISPLCCKF